MQCAIRQFSAASCHDVRGPSACRRRSHLRHYHHRDKQRDDQIDTEWVLRREQQRQDYQKEERRRATAAPTFIATDNVCYLSK